MQQTVFPSVEEALFLHTRLLEKFGGLPGVRDMGLLESALFRPRSGYYPSLSLQAAALMQSIASNHAFIDGNKRMSFALTAVFLRTNGFKLTVTADDGETFLIDQVIRAKVELQPIADWLEKHMTEITPLRR
jgi:death-on-curing protein